MVRKGEEEWFPGSEIPGAATRMGCSLIQDSRSRPEALWPQSQARIWTVSGECPGVRRWVRSPATDMRLPSGEPRDGSRITREGRVERLIIWECSTRNHFRDVFRTSEQKKYRW